MTKLLKSAATVATALSIAGGGIAGVAGASSPSISNTGYQSHNTVTSSNSQDVGVYSHNNVGSFSSNHQWGSSGFAGSFKNTSGGAAQSGNVSNGNTHNLTVGVNNSGAGAGVVSAATTGNGGSVGGGSIDTTGANSTNTISSSSESDVTVAAHNNVFVGSMSHQAGESGNAVSAKNTKGGGATSGNVSNSNSSTTTVNITN